MVPENPRCTLDILSQILFYKTADVGKKCAFSPNIHLQLRIRTFPYNAFSIYSPTTMSQNITTSRYNIILLTPVELRGSLKLASSIHMDKVKLAERQ
jgi:hypothetical protein